MMLIKNLNTTSRRATIDIDYEDARCLVNALYQLSKLDNVEKDANFDEVYANVTMLFSLLKHQHVPDFELDIIHKLRCAPVEVKKDGSNS